MRFVLGGGTRLASQRYVHDGHVKWKDDPGGTGFQIARELHVCGACASARQRSGPVAMA
ncbi:hypothetical protein ACLESO_05980 [Pyxidicoccus sp. 3LG]